MPTPRLVGGNEWKRRLADGKISLRHARRLLGQILDERPGPTTLAYYMAQIAVDMGELADVLNDLSDITEKSTTSEP